MQSWSKNASPGLHGGSIIYSDMGLRNPVQKLSEAEYLATERAAEFKSEFYDGEMFAIAGGSRKHSLIVCNLISALGAQLSRRPCVVFNSDLRLKIEATGLYTYPDLSVVCGPVKSVPGTDDTLTNPILVAEVLSDSTEGYDRGKKSENYRQIASLRAYLLVGQNEPHIELYTREANQWVLREAAGLENKLHIPPLEITIALSEVYANVNLLEQQG